MNGTIDNKSIKNESTRNERTGNGNGMKPLRNDCFALPPG